MKINKASALDWLRERWYLLFICFVLVLRVFFWLSPSHGEKIEPIYLWPAVITAGALVAYGRRERLPQGLVLTAGLFVWLLFSCAVNGDPYLLYNSKFFLYMFIALIGFFLAVPTLGESLREQGFHLLAALYCGMMLLAAAVGAYAAMTGTPIASPFSDEVIQVTGYRLYFLQYHPNEFASALMVAFLLMLYFALKCSKHLLKLPLLLGAVLLAFAVALTGSRTSIVAVAVSVGICGFWVLYVLLKKRAWWLRWPIGLAALCVLAVLTYQGMMASIDLASAITIKTKNVEQILAEQGGEEAASANMSASDENLTTYYILMEESRKQFNDPSSLNGRIQLWQAGVDYLKENPRALLLGVPDNVVSRIPAEVGRKEYHLHNAYLEMLLLGGIPGLLMYLGFLAVVFQACLRMAFGKEASLAHCFLGTVPPLLAICGMMEIYPLFSGNVMDMMAFGIYGAVIALAKRPEKRRPEPKEKEGAA